MPLAYRPARGGAAACDRHACRPQEAKTGSEHARAAFVAPRTAAEAALADEHAAGPEWMHEGPEAGPQRVRAPPGLPDTEGDPPPALARGYPPARGQPRGRALAGEGQQLELAGAVGQPDLARAGVGRQRVHRGGKQGDERP